MSKRKNRRGLEKPNVSRLLEGDVLASEMEKTRAKGMSRRELLRRGFLGAAGLTVAKDAAAAAEPKKLDKTNFYWWIHWPPGRSNVKGPEHKMGTRDDLSDHSPRDACTHACQFTPTNFCTSLCQTPGPCSTDCVFPVAANTADDNGTACTPGCVTEGTSSYCTRGC